LLVFGSSVINSHLECKHGKRQLT